MFVPFLAASVIAATFANMGAKAAKAVFYQSCHESRYRLHS